MLQRGDVLLGKYRIEALVGQGAFAHVYHATHLALNAPRALKILRRDAPGVGSADYAEFQARFQLEARLGAALDHPHVIRVYDFEQDGGTLILVMAYAAGGSLAERMAQARAAGGFIPIDQAVRIAREAAEGLAALHARDVVHRDVKPTNLLFDDRGRVKVGDLGLAQIPHGPSQRSLGGSLAQPHPGTPGYKSPEQERSTDYLTPASDVYALGAVLFEMLTGRLYRNQRPGTRAKSLRDDVPAPLDDLLARMLAKTPDDRPWDGAEAKAPLQGELRWLSENQSNHLPSSSSSSPKDEALLLATADHPTEVSGSVSDYDRVQSAIQARSKVSLSPQAIFIQILGLVDEDRNLFYSASMHEYVRTRVMLPTRWEDSLKPAEVIRAILAVLPEGAPSSDTARAIYDIYHIRQNTLAEIAAQRQLLASVARTGE